MSKKVLLTDKEISKVTGGAISIAVYGYLYDKATKDEELVDMIIALTAEQQELLLNFAINMFDNKTLTDVSKNYDSYRTNVVDYINQLKEVNPQ